MTLRTVLLLAAGAAAFAAPVAVTPDPSDGTLAVSAYAEGRWQEAAVHLSRWLALNPDSPRADLAWYLLGDSLLALSDWRGAASAYERVLSGFPASRFRARSLYGRGVALLEAGRPDEAARLLTSLVMRYPTHPLVPRAYFFLGEAMERLGETASAAESYARASSFPDSQVIEEATLARARCLLGLPGGAGEAVALLTGLVRSGSPQAARAAAALLARHAAGSERAVAELIRLAGEGGVVGRAALAELARLSPEVLAASPVREELLAAAKALGGPEGRMILVRTAAALAPREAEEILREAGVEGSEVELALLHSALRAGDDAEAAAALGRWLAAAGDAAPSSAWSALGWLQLRLGRVAEAKRSFERVRDRTGLGVALYLEGDYSAAAAYLSEEVGTPEGRLRFAAAQRAAGRPELALAAIEGLPGEEASLLRGELLFELGRFGEAAQEYARAYPGSYTLTSLVGQAWSLLALSMWEEAREKIQEAAPVSAGSEEAVASLARAAAYLLGHDGDHLRAGMQLRAAAERSEGPEGERTLYAAALEFLRAGSAAEAASLFRRAYAQRGPLGGWALVGAAVAEARSGGRAAAAAALEQALDEAGADEVRAAAAFGEGAVAEAGGAYLAAAEAYERAASFPGDLGEEAAYRRAWCILLAGRRSEAALAFDAYEQRFPGGRWVGISRLAEGFLLYEAGQKEAARASLEAAAESLGAADAPAVLLLGRLLLELGRAAAAARVLERLQAWDGSAEAVEGRLLLARYLAATGDGAAEDLFREVVAEAPSPRLRAEAALGLGRLLLASGRHEEAARVLADAVDHLPPEDACTAQLLLGEALEGAGKLEEASVEYLKAAYFYPDATRSRSGLLRAAEVFAKLGRDSDARRALEKIVREAPDSPLAEVARERLGQVVR